MSEIDKIINKDEKILWQGKPQFKIYFFVTILPPVFIATVMTIFGFSLSIILLKFFLLLLLVAILASLLSYLNWKYLLYVLTDKRVIIQSGLIGRDFKIIDYDQFKDANVNVNLLDKLIGINTGTINIYTGEMGIRTSPSYVDGQLRQSSYRISYDFYHIENPYKVFELFKKTSFDVKADMDYPNKLRPSENPGFNTKYEKQEKGS